MAASENRRGRAGARPLLGPSPYWARRTWTSR
jgi:hypothetical protein